MDVTGITDNCFQGVRNASTYNGREKRSLPDATLQVVPLMQFVLLPDIRAFGADCRVLILFGDDLDGADSHVSLTGHKFQEQLALCMAGSCKAGGRA
jgi:hypothetical protein